MSKNIDSEKIKTIDTSVDEEFKTNMFGFWKTKRKSEGKPLTAEEIEFYQSKKTTYDWKNMLTVTLPMAIFLALKKDMNEGSALTISLLIGVFIGIMFNIFKKNSKNENRN